MILPWHEFLRLSGARLERGRVLDFGRPAEELGAARSGSVLAEISHLGVLEFSGADAEAFLQGQLSCDVNGIAGGRAGLGAYCSPKGRMLADFFLARGDGRFLMLLSRALLASIEQRLRMFVLRSKVRISYEPGRWLLFGLAGPRLRAALGAWRGSAVEPGTQPDGSLVLELVDGRAMVLVPAALAAQAWQALGATLTPVGTPAWEWLDIRNGIPIIGPSTQDELVPQMANLDLIGGVSFTKGCYPGQEIVARAQYLGKLKRRMYLANVDGAAHPRPGDALYSDDLGDQASGLVVNAQPSPEGGYDLLAVAQVSSRENSVVRLKAPDGPALHFRPLPYEVTQAQ